MKRSKKVVVALLLSISMLFGTSTSAVAYATEAEARMQYISNYFVTLHIASDGTASISADLSGKCDGSASIMVILQRLVGDSWANIASWYDEQDYEYATVAEDCKVSPGTYRCVATFTMTTDSGSETKHATTAERTY